MAKFEEVFEDTLELFNKQEVAGIVSNGVGRIFFPNG